MNQESPNVVTARPLPWWMTVALYLCCCLRLVDSYKTDSSLGLYVPGEPFEVVSNMQVNNLLVKTTHSPMTDKQVTTIDGLIKMVHLTSLDTATTNKETNGDVMQITSLTTSIQDNWDYIVGYNKHLKTFLGKNSHLTIGCPVDIVGPGSTAWVKIEILVKLLLSDLDLDISLDLIKKRGGNFDLIVQRFSSISRILQNFRTKFSPYLDIITELRTNQVNPKLHEIILTGDCDSPSQSEVIQVTHCALTEEGIDCLLQVTEIISKFQVFSAIPISIHQYELDFTHQVYINNSSPKALIELNCEQVSNNILYNCKQKYYDHKCNAAISSNKIKDILSSCKFKRSPLPLKNNFRSEIGIIFHSPLNLTFSSENTKTVYSPPPKTSFPLVVNYLNTLTFTLEDVQYTLLPKLPAGIDVLYLLKFTAEDLKEFYLHFNSLAPFLDPNFYNDPIIFMVLTLMGLVTSIIVYLALKNPANNRPRPQKAQKASPPILRKFLG
jgi:hypothetical protein